MLGKHSRIRLFRGSTRETKLVTLVLFDMFHLSNLHISPLRFLCANDSVRRVGVCHLLEMPRRHSRLVKLIESLKTDTLRFGIEEVSQDCGDRTHAEEHKPDFATKMARVRVDL